MKKINYITYDAWWDTDKTVLPELCKSFSVTVFVSDVPAKHSKYVEKEDYGFEHFIRYYENLRDRNPFKFLSTLPFFVSIMKRCRDKDTITLYVLGKNPYLLILLYFFLPKKNTVICTHNYEEHVDRRSSIMARLNKLFFRKFANFLFFSGLQRDLFLKDFPKKTAYSIKMPLKDFGIPTAIRGDHRITFLFFGLIRDYKRLDVFIAAANQIPGDKARFVVAGKCDETKWGKYDAMMLDKSKFQCDIHFIDDKEVANYFSSSDFLVLPYDDATQSGPSLIALFYGLPIIATRLDAFSEIIRDKYNGFLFEKGNSDSLAGIFKQVVSMGKDELKQLRENNLKVRDEYIKGCDVVGQFSKFCQ